MNKILYIIFFSLSLTVLSGCEDLNEETYTQFQKGQFYQKPEHMQAATLGIYSPFGGMAWYNSMKELSLKPYKYTRLISSTAAKASRYTGSYSTGLYNSTWTMYYRAINLSNALMEAAPTTPFPAQQVASGVAQRTINTSLGEARFIRAWSYFNLVVLYGGVPLHLTETKVLKDCYVARSSVKEVYDLIIEDLTVAINYLPVTQAMKGRVTKKAATFLLGKVYLQMAGLPLQDKTRYQDAINTLRNLGEAIRMNQSGKFDCTLLANIEKVYDITNKNNQEILFSLQAGRDLLFNNACMEFAPPAAEAAIIGHQTALWPQIYGYSFDVSLYTQYHDKDERKIKLWAYRYLNSFGTSVTFGTGGYNRGVSILKYKDPMSTVGNQQANDIIIYRAPEVLLALAEAHNEADNLDSASMYLNRIRIRVNAPEYKMGVDFNSKETLGTKIRLERELELVGEFGEIFDMRRLGEVKDHLENHLDPGTKEGGLPIYSTKFELSPIPKTEMDRNYYITVNNFGW